MLQLLLLDYIAVLRR